MLEVPEQRQTRRDQIENVHGPDRTGRQAEQIRSIDQVADIIAQHNVERTVRRPVLGTGALINIGSWLVMRMAVATDPATTADACHV
jgi:hypothetical protein